MFIGRKKELQYLNDAYISDKAEFIFLYGERRVGKTQLLNEFCKNKPCIFYTCRECTDSKQLQSFTEDVYTHNILDFKCIENLSNWEDVFSSVLHINSNAKKLLIIDEFQYAYKGNKSIPSILQVLWDDKLSHENVMIILCGSPTNYIEYELLLGNKPLYGRTTGIYKLGPLPYIDAIKFFPNFTYEEKLIAYSILGGVPHYLKQFSDKLTLEDNIKTNILRKGCILYNEVDFLLKQELRETAIYNTIIRAIAIGNNSFNDILIYSQIEKRRLSVYLKNLINLNIVRKEIPSRELYVDNKIKSKYILTSYFFRFWYTFAYPNLTSLEKDDMDGVWNKYIKNKLHDFASLTFKDVCLDYLYKQNKNKLLPFRFNNATHYFGKTTQVIDGKKQIVNIDIDILAYDIKKENYIFGECKFTNEKFDLQQLKELDSKVFINGNIYLYLFSLSGFAEDIIEYSIKNKNIHLISVDDIISNY